MNLKEILDNAADKVIAALKLSDEPEKEKDENMEATATLEDGTAIFAPDTDEWVAGVAVFTRNGEGEPVSVADGEYTLSTGQIMVIAEGVLAEIREGEAQEEMSDDGKNVEEALSKIVEAFTSKLTEVTEAFNTRIEALESQNKDLKEKFEAQPAKGSVKAEPKANVKLSKNDRIGRTLQILKASN